MSNIPFTDSPRPLASHPLQPTDSPKIQLIQASTDDKQRNAIPPGPYLAIRHEHVIPTSSSAPASLRSLLPTRHSPALPEGQDSKQLTAEGSASSSNQRVSFNNHSPAPTPNHSPRSKAHVHPLLRDSPSQNIRALIDSGITKLSHSSDPPRPSSIARIAGVASPPKKPNHESPPSASAPQSRATSPRRLFSWSAFQHTPDDPFVPVNPFQIRPRCRRLPFNSPDIQQNLSFDTTCLESPFCCLPPIRCAPEARFLSDSRDFILDTLPRQIYLVLLLRLPSLYFSRIAKVYEDAQLSRPDLERMIESYSSTRQQQQRQRIVRSSPIPPGAHYHPPVLPFPDEWTSNNVSPALFRFKQSWEAFIDSLLREWKTLNLVSALLNTAVISMFQSQVMAADPVIRTAGLLSLTSALVSLSFGCIYIIRFGTMRSMFKATRWAEEAARTTTFIFWNVWVLLAMPVIWLAWSMIFFIVAILAFVWRYGSSADPATPPSLSPTAAIGPRVAVSMLFFIGAVYLCAIAKTLHTYGRDSENRLFRSTAPENDIPGREEEDAQGGEQGDQRGRRMGRARDGENGRKTARMTRRGHERDATEPGGLSAVTGLGLTGLDEVASLQSSLVEGKDASV